MRCVLLSTELPIIGNSIGQKTLTDYLLILGRRTCCHISAITMVSSPQCVTLFMQSWFYIDGMLNVVVTVVNIVSIKYACNPACYPTISHK